MFCIHVYQVKTLCHVQEWLLSHSGLFELSSFNKFYRGKLVGSIMLLPFEIFLC